MISLGMAKAKALYKNASDDLTRKLREQREFDTPVVLAVNDVD